MKRAFMAPADAAVHYRLKKGKYRRRTLTMYSYRKPKKVRRYIGKAIR